MFLVLFNSVSLSSDSGVYFCNELGGVALVKTKTIDEVASRRFSFKITKPWNGKTGELISKSKNILYNDKVFKMVDFIESEADQGIAFSAIHVNDFGPKVLDAVQVFVMVGRNLKATDTSEVAGASYFECDTF